MALESSGGVSVPLEGVDISASIKAMFERAMSVTLEHTTEKAWKKGETLTTERIFEGEEGQGLYIWQEQLQGRASTGGGVQVFLENFKETQTDTQPE